MTIRKATVKDIPRVLELLGQILALHAAIRPDLFTPGAGKYDAGDLAAIFQNENTPVYVAADEADRVIGYAFCIVREPEASHILAPRKTFYLDDLCVDEAFRGAGIGEALYRHVLREAARRGCYNVVLNVWEGNGARRFYEKMGMKAQRTIMEQILKEDGENEF